MYSKIFKRLLDLLGSIVLLVVLSPILLVIAILIKRKLGSPVIFRQKRPGYQGEPFTLLKFRTMTNEKDQKGKLLPNEERMTPLGLFLRKTSLDELPELYNVLKGEMSFVGPRPLKMSYLELYNAEQRQRHDVLPGITGWAQVNGRNAISFRERFEMDVWYVHHLSFFLDLKIIALTFIKVIAQENINPGQGSKEPFNGKN